MKGKVKQRAKAKQGMISRCSSHFSVLGTAANLQNVANQVPGLSKTCSRLSVSRCSRSSGLSTPTGLNRRSTRLSLPPPQSATPEFDDNSVANRASLVRIGSAPSSTNAAAGARRSSSELETDARLSRARRCSTESATYARRVSFLSDAGAYTAAGVGRDSFAGVGRDSFAGRESLCVTETRASPFDTVKAKPSARQFVPSFKSSMSRVNSLASLGDKEGSLKSCAVASAKARRLSADSMCSFGSNRRDSFEIPRMEYDTPPNSTASLLTAEGLAALAASHDPAVACQPQQRMCDVETASARHQKDESQADVLSEGQSDDVSEESSEADDDDTSDMSSEAGDGDAQMQAAEEMGAMVKARQQLRSRDQERRLGKAFTDDFYAGCLTLRSMPVGTFLGNAPPRWLLQISSINEDRLLKEMGITDAERNQIEGLQVGVSSSASKSSTTIGLSEAQLSMLTIARLARNPPLAVGTLQRRTSQKLLRPFPHGLRTSGRNMSPLPFWLTGAQSVALNMSNNDIPLQLHFALFKGSDGFVLKPSEMLSAPMEADWTKAPILAKVASDAFITEKSSRASRGWKVVRREAATLVRQSHKGLGDEKAYQSKEAFWPPPHEKLNRTTIEAISMHNMPKRGERRPRFDGKRGACHEHATELSGGFSLPDKRELSNPLVKLSLHPVGGFCAISKALPLSQDYETQFVTLPAVTGNGMNAPLQQTVHCVVGEPHATFLRVSVVESKQKQEIAYETLVLGRLQRGYRVIQMRNVLGTRIELFYLFVRITLGFERNIWSTTRQMRVASHQHRKENMKLKDEINQLRVSQEEQSASVLLRVSSVRRSAATLDTSNSSPSVVPAMPESFSVANQQEAAEEGRANDDGFNNDASFHKAQRGYVSE